MEQVSAENLGVFFEQWLKKAGHPCISYHWSKENNLVKLTIKQTQPSYVFNFPIEIKLSFKNNQAEIRKYRIYERETTILIRERDSIEMVQLDPNTNLLFEHSL
jgi:aminopeptidase N